MPWFTNVLQDNVNATQFVSWMYFPPSIYSNCFRFQISTRISLLLNYCFFTIFFVLFILFLGLFNFWMVTNLLWCPTNTKNKTWSEFKQECNWSFIIIYFPSQICTTLLNVQKDWLPVTIFQIYQVSTVSSLTVSHLL